MRKNSVKSRRVNDEVQRELSQILREIKDPRVSKLTSITMVEVATDLKTCEIHFSVLGTEEEGKETLQGLRSASGFIRRELAHRVNLRNTPELHFILDHSIAYGVEMTHKIDEVTAKDRAADEARRARGIDIDDTSAYVDSREEDAE